MKGECIVNKEIKLVDNLGIGMRMRSEREHQKITREDMAEAIDLVPLYIGQIERGERQMSLETLVKVINYLNIPSDFLLFGNIKGDELLKNKIINLLNRCQNHELKLIEKIILLVIEHTSN